MDALCYWGDAWFPLAKDAPKFFGFSDFLAASALMVLAWTLSGVKYQFRLKTAWVSIATVCYGVFITIGVAILVTDFWRAQQLCVPRGGFLTPESWQALLAVIFFVCFIAWLTFSFVAPTRFRRANAKRYFKAVHEIMQGGSSEDLVALAEELNKSIPNIVHHATERSSKRTDEKIHSELSSFADGLLEIIGHRRFCQTIVKRYPQIAITLMREVEKSGKFRIRLNVFVKNVFTEAILNKDSVLYHERDEYQSGLYGALKPFSHALLSNYEMVESLGTLFDINKDALKTLDEEQWRVLCQSLLMTLEQAQGAYFKRSKSRTFDFIDRILKQATSKLPELDGTTNVPLDCPQLEKCRIVIDLIDQILNIFDEHPDAETHAKVIRPMIDRNAGVSLYYQQTADMIFRIIANAATVRSPANLCEMLHKKIVWNSFFQREHDEPASELIKEWVCLKILANIKKLEHRPTLEGANLLGFCWSVMGIDQNALGSGNCKALKDAMLAWTQKHYVGLHRSSPKMAALCLIDGVYFDETRSRLVKPYPIGRLWHESEREELKLWVPGLKLQYISTGSRPYRYWSLLTVVDLIQACE